MASDLLFRANDPAAKLVEALATRLRRRQIVGSRNVALATAVLIQNIVRGVKYSTVDELLLIIRAIGRRLVDANPKELASGNIVRRILRLIREEFRAAAAAALSAPSSMPGTPFLGPETPGLHVPSTHYLSNDLQFAFVPSASASSAMPLAAGVSMSPAALARQTSLSNFVAMRHSRAQLERSGSVLDLSASTSSLFTSPSAARERGDSPGLSSEERAEYAMEREDFLRQSGKLKPVLIQAIEEVVGELETTHEDVAKGAREHIHSSEVIFTMGHSKTVESFLKQASRDRKFTVIVAESAPSYLGHTMAASLSAHGIPTLLVPDAAVHALMPRITKVILGAHSVLANGGLFALAGSLAAALAARLHAKPVVVTTGQFKFAPAWNLYHDYGAVDFQGPGAVVGQSVPGEHGEEVVDPYYDYIRPELVNLFVTNEGDHPPSYVYRIIKEAYDDDDVEL
ncbi:GCD complex subunit gcd7 [Cryptotrichosporon argae]